MQKTDILVCKHIYRIRCQRQFKHLTSLRLCRCRDDVARVIDTVRILRLCRLQHSPHSLAFAPTLSMVSVTVVAPPLTSFR